MNGSDVVDLTLKVNLSKLPKFTGQMVNDAAFHLFGVMEQYQSVDLISELCGRLNDYIASLENVINVKGNSLKTYIQRDGEVKDDLREYVRLYIDYNNEFRKKDFWSEVLEFIQEHKDLFAEYARKAYQMSGELEALTASLAFCEEIPLGTKEFPKFPAGRLLHSDTDGEICTLIKRVYDYYASQRTVADDTINRDRVISDIFAVNPSFFKDFKYEFSVRGKYNATVNQRIGKYFMFGER